MRAFALALPELPLTVVIWRLEFSIGSVARVLSDVAQLKARSNGACDPRDPDMLLRQIIPFLAAGFRAPNPE